MTAAQDNNHPSAAAGQDNLDANQERAALLFMLEDLERSQQKIKQAHQEWIAAVDAIADPIFMHDKDFRVMRSNRAYAEHAGMSVKEVLGKLYWEVFPKLDGPLPHCELATQRGKTSEEEVQLESGEFFLSRVFPITDGDGRYLYSLHIMEDINERKRAQEELQLRAQLLDSVSDTIFVLDLNENFIYLNEAAWKTRGYTRDEMMAMNLHTLDTPTYEKAIQARFRELMEKGRCIFESAHRRKDGSVMPVEISARIIELGGRKLALSTIRDITERKQAEKALLHANRAFKTLSAGNHELVHATDELQLLQAMCRVVVEIGGYRAAWVGYAQQDAGKTIRPMAQSGFEAGYLEALPLTWADSEYGQSPTGRAVRSGLPQISQDILHDPGYTVWREQAIKWGFAASIALPLRNDGGIFGNLSIYAAEVDAFDRGEVALLEEMVGDLAFGIRMLRLRLEQQRSAEQVRMGLEGTVQAIADLVEARDPYTAGHQQRVAQLAAAISVEMGLPEAQVRGIHLAGIIHDLGKIQTPAEILSKPGKLSAVEFSLIKEHPQTGYEILKDIEFPWPIAQIVLQHHEKLDGSGYPHGLKGSEILLEARILSVADVVEAMSSHRPYRPGLGVDAALAEIGNGRGTRYDPDVVDACVRLFKEKNYNLKQVFGKQ